jgi:GMP synthase (glutamine-hydrolysing)
MVICSRVADSDKCPSGNLYLWEKRIMRLHYLQHVPFENPANILTWANRHGFQVTLTRLFAGESLPEPESIDWLVIMGGLMSAYEEDRYPWLVEEKRFIDQVIKRGGVALGVCLGAQLLADVLGARVYRHRVKEIGWFPVRLTEAGQKSHLFKGIPEEFMAFQWHGDTFDIPSGCQNLAESEKCVNQAFEYDQRVFALQFHVESTEESIRLLIENCGHELIPAPFVQPPEQMLPAAENLASIEKTMNSILEKMLSIREA